MSWGRYIARTAVRRVVWIVVGVVVIAALAVVGVKAEDSTCPGGTYSGSGDGEYVSGASYAPEGWSASGSILFDEVTGASPALVSVVFQDGDGFVLAVEPIGSAASWDNIAFEDVLAPAGSAAARIRVQEPSPDAGMSAIVVSCLLQTAEGEPGPTPTPTPTPGESSVVELSEDDRDLLRLGIYAMVTIGGLLVFGSVVAAVATVAASR